MIMVDGTIGNLARPISHFFAVLHLGGIDSYFFGSSLGDTIIVCSFSFLVYIHGLHTCALRTVFPIQRVRYTISAMRRSNE